MIDLTTPLGIRAAKRLNEEHIAWLTTVTEKGMPQPNPVWFYWGGEEILIYSQPSAHKVGNIARNANVSLNFQANSEDGDVVVLTGRALVEKNPPPHDPKYIQKYHEKILGFGLTPETFAKSYSVLIRMSPKSLRGF